MRRLAPPRYQDGLGEPLGGKDSLREPPELPNHTPFFPIPNLFKPRCVAGPPEHVPSARYFFKEKFTALFRKFMFYCFPLKVGQ
jgi:hypothetical protein